MSLQSSHNDIDHRFVQGGLTDKDAFDVIYCFVNKDDGIDLHENIQAICLPLMLHLEDDILKWQQEAPQNPMGFLDRCSSC